MKFFGLWWLTSLFSDSPLVGLLVALGVLYALEGGWRGRFFNPFPWFDERSRMSRLGRDLAANPHDKVARLELGRLLVQHKRGAEAVPHLEKAAAELDSPEAHYFLGRARLQAGRVQEGVAEVERALKLRSDLLFGEPLKVVGDHFYDKGDLAAAGPWYERFAEVNSSNPEVWYKLGMCRKKAGNNNLARDAFTESIESYRSAPTFQRGVANQLWKWRAGREL